MGQVVSQDELILHVAERKRNRQRIVFTNGCFDLLHYGHIRCLEEARELGDLLIVAINSDASAARLKGAGRPVIPQAERAEILAALACVDFVVVFDEPTPREIIEKLSPDVLVKGGNWRIEEVVGREEVESAGGRVVLIPFQPGWSSTNIIQRIRKSPSASSK